MDFQVRIADPALADFEKILEYSWATFPATAESFRQCHSEPDDRRALVAVGGRAGVISSKNLLTEIQLCESLALQIGPELRIDLNRGHRK